MSSISNAAAAARENARSATGQFGEQERTDAEVTLPAPVSARGLTTETPAVLDGVLADLYEKEWVVRERAERARSRRDNYAKIAAREHTTRYDSRIAELNEEIDGYDQTVQELREEANPFEAEYDRRGGWERAFLVTKGQLHKSMRCSTCNREGKPTRFHWMTEYSGQNEEQIVAAGGSRACTVCYPSAPVDVLRRDSTMLTPDEEAERAAREERARAKKERDAATAAKAITNPDGSVLRGRYGTVKTLTTARSELTNAIIHANLPNARAAIVAEEQEWQETLLAAISAKTDTDANEVYEEHAKKARAKMKRDYGVTPTF